MKILQVNCVYAKGSTGRIVSDIHTQLMNAGIESVVCYGRGVRANEPNVNKTCGELYAKFNNLLTRFTGIMYGGCFFSTNKLLRIIRKEKPDIVHIQCINGYFVNIYRFITWLKKKRIKTVLTLHAEFMHTANCSHALDCDRWKTGCGHCPRLRQETKSLLIDHTAYSWKRMKQAFEGFDALVVTSVSPWLKERAKQSPILSAFRHEVVLNGLDTNVFRSYDTKDLKASLGLTDQKIVFHATTFFSSDPEHLKGGYYVLKLAERMKDEPVKFLIAGHCDRTMPVPSNVILLGHISDQRTLARYYSMADVTLLTSKKETFSMVCAESLCCGTPVVGFKAGAPEQISLPEYSEFVEHGNVEALMEALLNMLHSQTDKAEIEHQSSQTYSRDLFVQKYLSIYTELKENT